MCSSSSSSETRETMIPRRRKVVLDPASFDRLCRGKALNSSYEDKNKSAFSSSSSSSGGVMMNVNQVNRMTRVAAGCALCFWIFLLIAVYAMTPTENLVYLDGAEQKAAAYAFFIFASCVAMMLLPFAIKKKGYQELSGMAIAALTVQTIAMTTNALLAWAPTVVVVDPITHARVYYIRWCEWIHLSGCLTFLSEIIDCPNDGMGLFVAVFVSLGQAFSCVCALFFPLCPNLISWVLFMTLSCILWATIFPRLRNKFQTFSKSHPGISFSDVDRYCRLRSGYHLLLTCTVVWTVLVILYFGNMIVFRVLPDDHAMRSQALPMVLDTFFDVLAKIFYMRVILEAHRSIFDVEGRTQRQLSDLRKMMSVLWKSSSDAVVISVRHGTKMKTMISPAYAGMVGVLGSILDSDECRSPGVALMVEATCESSILSPKYGTLAQFEANSRVSLIDYSEVLYSVRGEYVRVLVTPEDMDETMVTAAKRIVAAAWKEACSDLYLQQQQHRRHLHAAFRKSTSDIDDDLVMKAEKMETHEILNANGSIRKCELKAMRHDDNAVIATVRDVTERYLRFDAEHRAHAEVLARQKEARNINRLTKHEVKNGMLAGIALCNEMYSQLLSSRGSTERSLKSISCFAHEIDGTLQKVLRTVLDEAMVRDILHGSYIPDLQPVNLLSVLSSAEYRGMSNSTQRFPIVSCPPTDKIPRILLDPQLLYFIHRNAISNACKYGRKDGIVETVIRYDKVSKHLHIQVLNEPGEKNAELLLLDDAARSLVFQQGERLQVHFSGENGEIDLSAGDGGWIMQKCAKILGGRCDIRFGPSKTVFQFICCAESFSTSPAENEVQFSSSLSVSSVRDHGVQVDEDADSCSSSVNSRRPIQRNNSQTQKAAHSVHFDDRVLLKPVLDAKKLVKAQEFAGLTDNNEDDHSEVPSSMLIRRTPACNPVSSSFPSFNNPQSPEDSGWT